MPLIRLRKMPAETTGRLTEATVNLGFTLTLAVWSICWDYVGEVEEALGMCDEDHTNRP